MTKKRRGWEPLRNVTAEIPDEVWRRIDHENPGSLEAIWRSNVYEVFVRVFRSEGMPEGFVTWLSIKRLTRGVVHDWRHLQRIKNEICGPEREACEVYPAESRLVDTSNQYHLWVLPEGHSFPFGYAKRDVKGVGATDGSGQRPYETGLVPFELESE